MITLTQLNFLMQEKLFDLLPMSIAVINPEFNLVYGNKTFEELFGDWQQQKCFKVYKSRNAKCDHCGATQTFLDGATRKTAEVGFNKSGHLTQYMQHTIPVKDENGQIPFILEMATDITETERLRKEHKLLFDKVPCSILIIDRNYHIVRTNEKVRNNFGDITGELCFEVLKGRNHECKDCNTRQTFEDGKMHSGIHVWKNSKNEVINFQVTTVPLFKTDRPEVDLVMEMAVNINQTMKLKDELETAHSFMESMISTSIDGIIALDTNDEVTIFNPAAREIFDIGERSPKRASQIAELLPAGVWDEVKGASGHVYLGETEVRNIEGEAIPVRLVGNQVYAEGKKRGMAFSVMDLRQIKQLENEKLEAERLAAVGQTVAGLAHGVKNLITGLEGGMYMLNSGMKKSSVERIHKGMDMLNRNIERVSTFVKEFLNFSKGRKIDPKTCDPIQIADDVVEIYASRAAELGISLIHEHDDEIPPANMDCENMHECLTNLVGNAIDACRMSDKKDACQVRLHTHEKENHLIFEVSDNGCGMDYEVKKKVFTNFFTTKGLGGTGLGLLMTKKIVQEHGGKIELSSEPGEGTTFRIILDRKRLPLKTPEEGLADAETP